MLFIKEALPGNEGFPSTTPSHLHVSSFSFPKTQAVVDVNHENTLNQMGFQKNKFPDRWLPPPLLSIPIWERVMQWHLPWPWMV